jgi:hypothetical protein
MVKIFLFQILAMTSSVLCPLASAPEDTANITVNPELYEGQKVLIIDTEMEIKNPGMFQYVMNFVKSNGLKMFKICEIEEAKLGS